MTPSRPDGSWLQEPFDQQTQLGPQSAPSKESNLKAERSTHPVTTPRSYTRPSISRIPAGNSPSERGNPCAYVAIASRTQLSPKCQRQPTYPPCRWVSFMIHHDGEQFIWNPYLESCIGPSRALYHCWVAHNKYPQGYSESSFLSIEDQKSKIWPVFVIETKDWSLQRWATIIPHIRSVFLTCCECRFN